MPAWPLRSLRRLYSLVLSHCYNYSFRSRSRNQLLPKSPEGPVFPGLCPQIKRKRLPPGMDESHSDQVCWWFAIWSVHYYWMVYSVYVCDAAAERNRIRHGDFALGSLHACVCTEYSYYFLPTPLPIVSKTIPQCPIRSQFTRLASLPA